MNIQIILIGLVFSLVNVFPVQCAANFFDDSTLPKTMPAGTYISFSSGGGMVNAYQRITVSGNQLEFEVKEASKKRPKKWTAKISQADMENLYQTFVTNEFDLVRNDTRDGIVYDAPSSSVVLSIGSGKVYNISSGANSPLSGDSLKHYQAVADAIYALVNKYESKRK